MAHRGLFTPWKSVWIFTLELNMYHGHGYLSIQRINLRWAVTKHDAPPPTDLTQTTYTLRPCIPFHSNGSSSFISGPSMKNFQQQNGWILNLFDKFNAQDPSQADLNNHANKMNHNNDAYWDSYTYTLPTNNIQSNLTHFNSHDVIFPMFVSMPITNTQMLPLLLCVQSDMGSCYCDFHETLPLALE